MIALVAVAHKLLIILDAIVRNYTMANCLTSKTVTHLIQAARPRVGIIRGISGR
jgi:hypothetical protein